MGVREFKPLLHTHLQNGSHSKALKEVRGIKASLVVQWLRHWREHRFDPCSGTFTCLKV